MSIQTEGVALYADLESTVRLKVIIASICAEAVALVDSQKSSCVHSATASVAVLSTHLMVSKGGLALDPNSLQLLAQEAFSSC